LRKDFARKEQKTNNFRLNTRQEMQITARGNIRSVAMGKKFVVMLQI